MIEHRYPVLMGYASGQKNKKIIFLGELT